MKSIERGAQQEQSAAVYLETQGLEPVATNYHSRYGEIDLIMRDGSTIVFVEVRYRRREDYGGALESITTGKKRKIALTALNFLQQYKLTESFCRFDVIAMSDKKTEWLKSAFDSPL